MTPRTTIIGRAGTVLVFGHNDTATAVVSSIVARPRHLGTRKRLIVRGPVVFEPAVLDHLCGDVLKAVDRICGLLGVRRQKFELEIVTPGVASIMDVGVNIAGFSADLPAFLALLSAALRMPVPQDVVCTGHVASADGDIRPVRHIPAKLAAAARERNVRMFVCPSLDADGSVAALAPREQSCAQEAIAEARDRLQVVCVSDVQQLLSQVIDDASLVLASLRAGFFINDGASYPGLGTIERSAGFLASGSDQRFWSALEAAFSSGQIDQAKRLLLERVNLHLRRKDYPHGLGSSLLPLVRSMAPPIRRSRSIFPLLPIGKCYGMAQFAAPEDHADVQALVDSVSGTTSRGHEQPDHHVGMATADSSAAKAVEAVLMEISPEQLSQTICLPIDSARASYLLSDVVTDSHEMFFAQIEAFYLAMLRRTTIGPVVANDILSAEACALVARAFGDKGDMEGALAEARYGLNGGMRYVLDVMTDQFKAEQQSKRINRVLKSALDALDWNGRVMFMKAFMELVGPLLPDEIRSQPPQRFARHYEIILKEYTRSINHVNRVLRRL